MTFGVNTGVTKMSLPSMNWRSIASNSGSCGNSKKSARKGGVPYRVAFAKSVYYEGHLASARQGGKGKGLAQYGSRA